MPSSADITALKHYLAYKGKPTLLFSSDQRFAAVINPEFGYTAFLDKLRAKRMNFTRIYPGMFLAFHDRGNWPKPGRQLLPWRKTDTPGADERLGGLKYDLDSWDEAYFARLLDFCGQARERDIIVMPTFFNALREITWEYHPLRQPNNIQGIGDCAWDMFQSLDAGARVLEYQERYVREIIRRLNGYGNILYYMCSEPCMSNKPAAVYTPWVDRMLDVFVSEERSLPNKHLLSQCISREFYTGPGVADFSNDPRVPYITTRMMRSREILENEYHHDKPIVHDGSATFSDNDIGTTLQYYGDKVAATRVEAWETMLRGAASYMQYNDMFTDERPAGTVSSDAVLDMLGILRDFLESLDFAALLRHQHFIVSGVPKEARAFVLYEHGKQYALYLHHGKEHQSGRSYVAEPGDYQTTIVCVVPAGTYRVEWILPATGAVLQSQTVDHPGAGLSLPTPKYTVDIALRIRRS